jgi:hypothetical protein
MAIGNRGTQTPITKTAYKTMYIHSNEINSISIYKLYDERKLNPSVAVGTQEVSEPDTEICST